MAPPYQVAGIIKIRLRYGRFCATEFAKLDCSGITSCCFEINNSLQFVDFLAFNSPRTGLIRPAIQGEKKFAGCCCWAPKRANSKLPATTLGCKTERYDVEIWTQCQPGDLDRIHI